MMLFRNCLLGGAALLAAGLVSLSGAHAAAITHASHRAFYEIDIARVDPGSNIVDAKGRMIAEWQRACEGWTTNQRLIVSMAPGEGEPIDSEVSLTSFENIEGTEYTFDSETRIGGQTVERVRGHAERPAPGEPGTATYDEPEGMSVELPADTVFPYEHTITVLEAALRGEKRSFGHYFDGSQPELSPMAANALILGKPRDGGEGELDRFGQITDQTWWPVRLAMFGGGAAAAGEEQPEFEMTQLLQENGVVRSFEFDYGDFSLKASLVDIELIDAPRCD